MALKLMYITNNPTVAMIAEEAGVDRIWIDLERIGKEARQPGMDTVKSNHKLEDVAALRPFITKAELMVRVNPLHENSKEEIDAVIDGGADLVMLPFFHTSDEVKKFVSLVGKRAKVMLLVETKEAFESLEEIVRIPGIDEIHIGLNDLHLSYGMTFMFEPLANGMIERACRIIAEAGVPYGFGGIARLGEGMLPAEVIVAEHYRLGSSMVILSRTFCDIRNAVDTNTVRETFQQGIEALRKYETLLMGRDEEFYSSNEQIVKEKTTGIVELIRDKRSQQ